ncbi:MAG: sterol desaturase family protein, partial [Cellvibrio sp.]|uniref:sterol desaturase family protein n=1 Tax=Cellvibrio sp. TaxID=1965322 RepID=UPI002717B470|nr:sterol desaturase family protein [Cellvibrio sp.]
MSEEFEDFHKLVFFSAVVLLVLLERIRSFQRQPVGIETRWTTNIGLFLTGNVVTRVVMPVGIFVFALDQPPGVLSRLGLPFAAQLLLTFLILDLWHYWEHRLFHLVPFLWRAHLVHHSDTQLDVTTSERHHPLEVLLGTIVMMALVVLLGLPARALGVYLLADIAVSLSAHANLRLPVSLERWISWLLITPKVHAVHHSARQAQTDSNYGSVLTIWDRMFGSYVDPQHAHIEHFGLDYFHQQKDNCLQRVLLQPFLFRKELLYPSRNNELAELKPVAATSSEPPIAVVAPGWREALLGAIAGCVLVSLVLWPTLIELVSLWQSNEAYRYSWLVLPMVVYLLGWHHRQEIVATSPQPDSTGVFVAAGAAACWGASALMNINIGQQLGLILAVHGVAMSALGWRSYWRLFPTLALLFLMIPSGDVLQPALRFLTVNSIEQFAVIANLPHSI